MAKCYSLEASVVQVVFLFVCLFGYIPLERICKCYQFKTLVMVADLEAIGLAACTRPLASLPLLVYFLIST